MLLQLRPLKWLLKTWPLDLLFCDLISGKVQKSGSTKVVLQTRIFFFWSTTFLQPEKMWIYSIKPPFFLVNHFSRTRFLEPDFSNQISQTIFLEPLFYNFLEKWLQIKWLNGQEKKRKFLHFRLEYYSYCNSYGQLLSMDM